MHSKKGLILCIWLIFIAYLFSFLLTTSSDLTQDLGRHLKLGEIIMQTKSVPTTNLLSYTYPDFPFINHHWFSEVILSIFQQSLGLNSLILLKAVIIILAIAIAIIASGSFWGFGVAFFISPLILERADIRPEIFGFLAFSLLLLELRRVQKTKTLSVYIPIIFLLWVNIHISFAVGLFLVGILFLVAPKSKRNIVVFVSSILVLFINPNGVQGALAPFTIFRNYGYSIVENQNMLFLSSLMNDIFIRGYFISLPFTIVALCILFLKKKYIFSFLLLFFSLLALYQVRHLPFYVLTVIALAPTALVDLHVPMKPTIRKGLSLIFIYFLLAGTIFFGSNLFFETFDINKSFGFGYEMQNSKVFSFLKKYKREGAIFNNFDIGSYLSYGLYPGVKVFVDGRPEAYPSSFFQNIYIPLQEDQEKQDTFFKQYDIHTIVFSHTDQTPWGSSFLIRTLQNKQWKLLYFDTVFVIFSDAQNATDIRNTDAFMQQIDKEERFFSLIHYVSLLGAMGQETKAMQLLQKVYLLRPNSCSLIRMRQRQFSAPWCIF